jgi:hypothetical protein
MADYAPIYSAGTAPFTATEASGGRTAYHQDHPSGTGRVRQASGRGEKYSERNEIADRDVEAKLVTGPL